MNLRHDIVHTFQSARRWLMIITTAFPVIYLLSGFYLIDAEQRGVVTRLGKVINDNVLPGMHYRIPYPIDDVELISVTELRSLVIDFSREYQAAYLQSELTTRGGDLVNMRLEIQYTVAEPALFYYAADDVENLLKQVTMSKTIYYTTKQDFETLLTTGRSQLQSELRDNVQFMADDLKMGLRVNSITIRRLEPPSSAKRAFDRVQAAPAEKMQRIEQALANRETAQVAARSAINQIELQSKAKYQEIVQSAQGDASRYQSIMSGLETPVALERYYYESLEAITSKVELQVTDGR
ncbi:protease modulator HflK [Photobacterium sp. DNB23_23_1]|uniref:Protease modulator HflK n=1 Tax=Photobacterium pectinilyticum TaxID=2906793 RepID=A0ABT1MXV5_9GAMM|nr:protease modulator HflK [Photobacterium sp. ZSDE20]MCQ1057321.1 protease modulator HflK [Photobacterium sp. ZSDE20]MDD1821780.1 protease modulator HflK [Photobacterium sp. ZSDE20]